MAAGGGVGRTEPTGNVITNPEGDRVQARDSITCTGKKTMPFIKYKITFNHYSVFFNAYPTVGRLARIDRQIDLATLKWKGNYGLKMD